MHQMLCRSWVMSRTMRRVVRSGLAVLLALNAMTSPADELRVAVASNFAGAMRAIAASFEQHSGHDVRLVFGATGKHYAQILHGAPFDAYFAADLKRPRLLEQQGLTIAGSRFTYAIGRLALWSPRGGFVDQRGEVLSGGDFHHLAIANPKLAPYGRAAREVLRGRGLWQTLQDRLVRGENIGQTFAFVASGNAELGLIAWSQIKRPDQAMTGSWWRVPATLHAPIEQQAVLLRDRPATRSLMDYLHSDEAITIIHAYGYGTP